MWLCVRGNNCRKPRMGICVPLSVPGSKDNKPHNNGVPAGNVVDESVCNHHAVCDSNLSLYCLHHADRLGADKATSTKPASRTATKASARSPGNNNENDYSNRKQLRWSKCKSAPDQEQRCGRGYHCKFTDGDFPSCRLPICFSYECQQYGSLFIAQRCNR